VDANVFYLHGTEIEFAGTPSVLVAASGTTVIEGRDDEVVLASLLCDCADGDAGDEIEGIVPTWLVASVRSATPSDQ